MNCGQTSTWSARDLEEPPRSFAKVLLALLLLGCVSLIAQDVFKYDFGPNGQTVYPGFTAVGPDSSYSPVTKFGWTKPPGYFGKFSRWEAFPDALTCDFAAPAAPLTGQASGYKGSFEFRVDLPAGDYLVQVISGNYGYLPSQIETFAYDLDTQRYRVPEPEEIQANGHRVFRRAFTSNDLVREFYHDLNTVLRRGMTLWDRVVAWRFPTRTFKVAAPDGSLRLTFANLPVNAVMIWPAAKEAEATAFLEKLTAERRAQFPAKDTTPPPDGILPSLPTGAEDKGYFLFLPARSDEIHPNTIPKPAWIKPEVQAFAARGEFRSFAVAVYPLRDLTDCSASVSNFASSEGAVFPSARVDVRVLRYLELQFTSASPDYETVAYLPVHWGHIPIDRGISRVYWVTVHVPDDIRPGIYHGRFAFQPANAPATALPIAFRVLPFKLRPLTDHYEALFHDYWQFPGGGVDRRVQWQRDAGFNVITARGIMPNLAFRNGKLDPLNFLDWERQLDVYRRNGFPMQLVISQGATRGAYGAVKEYVTEPEFEGRPQQVKDRFSPEFEDCYKKLARAISDEFKHRGWPDIVFYDAGEAEGYGPRGVRSEAHLMRLLHEAGVKNTASVSGYATPLSLRDSVPYMYLALISQINEENVKKVREAGSRLGIYGPGETRFERGFWFWRTGALVCSEEGGVCLYGNPYDPLDGSNGHDWGDVYPTPEGPTPSLHTIGKRDGITDARYLFQLEQLIAEAKRSGSPAAKQAAAQARELLDAIADGIQLDIHYYETVAGEPSDDVLDGLRLRVADQIATLGALLGQ